MNILWREQPLEQLPIWLMNRKTAAYYFHRLRVIISQHLEAETDEYLSGEIEVDESYFGGRRKGKRGRGAGGKIPVFGLLKRGGKVYTKIISDAKAATLLPIIKEKVIPDSIVYSDSWLGYNVLDALGVQTLSNQSFKVVCRPTQSHKRDWEFLESGEAASEKIQWSSQGEFPLFLKECEWRFNNPKPHSQLNQLKQWVKNDLG